MPVFSENPLVKMIDYMIKTGYSEDPDEYFTSRNHNGSFEPIKGSRVELQYTAAFICGSGYIKANINGYPVNIFIPLNQHIKMSGPNGIVTTFAPSNKTEYTVEKIKEFWDAVVELSLK